MKDTIFIKNCVQKLLHRKSTMFVDQKEKEAILRALPSFSCQEFHLYEECDKVQLYVDEKPTAVLLHIHSVHPLTHASILGALFALGIDQHTFGDIIAGMDSYVVVLPQIADLVLYQLDQIGKEKVTIAKVELDVLHDYRRHYLECEIKVPSLRIDVVLAKLLHLSRSQIEEKIKDKEILLNYEIVKNGNKNLKEEDVFSIRRYGKYRYKQVTGKTKKGDFLIRLLKYD